MPNLSYYSRKKLSRSLRAYWKGNAKRRSKQAEIMQDNMKDYWNGNGKHRRVRGSYSPSVAVDNFKVTICKYCKRPF